MLLGSFRRICGMSLNTHKGELTRYVSNTPYHSAESSRRHYEPMKRLHWLVMFLCLSLGIQNAWGDTANFAPSNFSGQGTSGTGSAISATVNGVTFACDKGYGTTQFRCYKGSTITISSSNTITAISFSFSSGYSGGLSTSYTNLSTTSWTQSLSSQARITACTVTYSSSYTITAQSNNTSYGTVSLSGTTITGSPKPGYTYASPAYTVSPANSATVSQSGNTFTVTPSANTTVTINFEAIPKYTVSFNAHGVVTDPSDRTEANAGAGVELPNLTGISCGDWVFAGWAANSVTTETTTEPTLYAANSTYHPTGNVTLHAVYSKTETGSATTWEPVSSAPDDWSGDYVIVNSAKTHAMTSDFHSGTSGEFKGAEVNITSNKVESPTDKMIWTVAKNGNNAQYSFKNKSTGTYANITSTNSTNAALSSSAVWFTIATSGTTGVWKVNSVTYSARCFSWYASNSSFRTYANSSNNTGYLYKKTTTNVNVTSYLSTPNCLSDPEFNIDEGTYCSTQSVTLSCATQGASIYYTTNGTDPTSSSTQYSSTISVSSTTTIKAIAVKNGTSSNVVSATYTINNNTYTVTYHTGTSENISQATGVTQCTGVELPSLQSPPNSSYYTFLGWGVTEQTALAASYPTTVYKAGSTFIPTQNTDLYAVYAEDDAETTWDWITDLEDMTGSEHLDVLDEYLLSLYYENGDDQYDYFFDGTVSNGHLGLVQNTSSKDYYTKSEITTLDAATITLEDGGGTDTYYIKVGNQYLVTTGTAANGFSLSNEKGEPWVITDLGIDPDDENKYNGWELAYATGSYKYICGGGTNNCDYLVTTNEQSTTQGYAIYLYRKDLYYTTSPKCVTPTFEITGSNTVAINSAMSGSTIYYTTNGSTPTTGSSTYTGEITLTETTTIKAIAAITGMENSAVAEQTFTVYPIHWYIGNMATPYQTTFAIAGENVAVPALPTASAFEGTCLEGKAFVGWTTSAISGTSVSAPATLYKNSELPEASAATSYYAVYATASTQQAYKTDVLNQGTTGVTGTTYSDWTADKNKSGINSDAEYSGNSAADHSSIQLRVKNSNSGIVTTTSGGKLKSITVEWESNTQIGRTLDIYGKNTAYSAPTDLYNNSSKGDFLSNIVYGTSTNYTVPQGSEYEYIGLRSNDGAMYLTSITIEWDASTTTYSNYFTQCCSVDAPSFNPASGATFVGSQNVSISCETSGATIRYTTNGTTPSVTNGEIYNNSPISVTDANQTTTIKAIAIKDYCTDSEVSTATYTRRCATPTISLTGIDGNIFTGTQTITMSCNTTGATIYYTTNGNNPTTSSSVYDPGNKPSISATTTVKAIAILDGYSNSETAMASYERILTAPEFSPAEGKYAKSVSVTISAEAGATIHYTIDGTNPSASSPTYSTAIEIISTTTVNAIAIKSGCTDSEIASATYTILSGVVYEKENISKVADMFPNDVAVYVANTGTQYYAMNDTSSCGNSNFPCSTEVTNSITADNKLVTNSTTFLLNIWYYSNSFKIFRNESDTYRLNGYSNSTNLKFVDSTGNYEDYQLGTSSSKTYFQNTKQTDRFVCMRAEADYFGNYKPTLPANTPELYVKWSDDKIWVSNANLKALTLNTFVTAKGTASAAQSFYVKGRNLSEVITISNPSGFEFCLTENGSYSSSLTLSPTDGKVAYRQVFVRISASADACNLTNGNISISSSGETKNVAVTYRVSDAVATVPSGKALGTSKQGNTIIAKNPVHVVITGGAPSATVTFAGTGTELTFYTIDGDSKFSNSAITLDASGSLEKDVYIAYTPTSAGDGSVTAPTFTIGWTDSPANFSKTFNGDGSLLKVRNMQDRFAIVAKDNSNNYYILPAGISSASTPTAANGTVANGKAKTDKINAYTIWAVGSTNSPATRMKANGAAVRFSAPNDGYKGLWGNTANDKNTIENNAVIDEVSDAPTAANYEWTIETTEDGETFKYSLHKNCGSTDGDRYLRYWVANSVWGTYNSGINELYFLPITTASSDNVLWTATGLKVEGASGGTYNSSTLTPAADGTMTITPASMTKGTDITYTADGNEYTATVPAIVSDANATSVSVTSDEDLVILPGAKLSLTSAVNARNLYIYRDRYTSGQLDVKTGGSVTLAGNAYLVYTVDPQYFYFFGTPYASTGSYFNGETTAYGNNAAVTDNWWMLKSYNGAWHAAQSGSNGTSWWQNLNEPSLAAGSGYAIGIDIVKPSTNANAMRSYKFDMGKPDFSTENGEKSISVTAHNAANPLNAGWNALCNPYLHTINGAAALMDVETVNKFLYFVIPYRNYDDRYQQYLAPEVTLQPFDFFAVQVKGSTNGTLTFGGNNASRPSARHRGNAAAQTMYLRLHITAPDTDTDFTTIVIDDECTASDLSDGDQGKFGSGNYIQLYTLEQGNRLAFDAINATDATEGTALGYYAPVAGEYTLSYEQLFSTSDDILHVWLTDNTEQVTRDLLVENAVITTASGTYDNRLTVRVEFRSGSGQPTDVHNVADDNIVVKKEGNKIEVRCDKVQSTKDYIRLFDAAGKLIDQSPMSSGTWQSAPLPNGVYMLRIGGRTAKVVI